MEGQSGLSELSVISWVSAVEGCPLSGVPIPKVLGGLSMHNVYQALFALFSSLMHESPGTRLHVANYSRKHYLIVPNRIGTM